jgi:hypothetical protein
MISTTESAISYTGNASTSTPYPIPFPFLVVAHIAAIVIDEEENETELAPEGVTVTPEIVGGRIVGGELTTTEAVPATSTLRIERRTPAIQPADFNQGGRLDAETFETALDRVTMMVQEVRRDAENA